jgi:hypothetical protein
MKKISIILFGAILLASCSHKEAGTGNLETKPQEEFTAATAAEVTESESPKDYRSDKKSDEAIAVGEANKDVAITPVTLSLASVSTYEKSKEDQNTNTMTVKNRVETKEPSQIIRNAKVDFQVESADSSHGRIAQSLAGANAYFGTDRRSQNSYEIQQMMVIRVPSANFDKLMDVLMKESVYTNNKDITADDVTAEFVDIQVRLKSKKEVEKRYIELLGRAQKVSDIIEVESNLRVIREEIESMEGRLKLLKDQVAYSTITLTITQRLKGEAQPEVNFGYRLKAAAVNGWRGLEFFALSLVSAWPFLLLISPFIIWIVIRRRRRAAKV